LGHDPAAGRNQEGARLMRIFGLPVPFTGEKQKALASVSAYGGGWYPIIREPYAGAWQRNVTINTDTAASFHADFACKTLIARDIAKLRVKLVEKDADDIWSEVTNPAFSPVLRRPNTYQSHNQFWECWLLSKLARGNTYVLKERDNRQVVTALHVLDPTRVQPLVADDGSVFYRMSSDNLASLETDVIVPAREIIHDRMNCLFHPLVGTPPVFASGLSSMLGINAQKASALLFENSSTPGGILTGPKEFTKEQQDRFKEEWEAKFTRGNYGRVAILGGELKYEKVSMTNVEGQLIESLKWSAEVVCSVYHVPPYKVGVGALPSYNNVQSLNIEYYSQALQSQIEEIEELLDYGLGIGGTNLGTEFDIENLLRMDSVTQVATIKDAVGASVISPNEGRAKLGYKPVKGGESPLSQQQYYSLEALAKRDAQADPFAPKTPPALPPPAAAPIAADSPAAVDEQKLAAIAQLFAWELKDAAGASHGPQ
jgi:HK97 family phage portal protein